MSIVIGLTQSGTEIALQLSMANRHGLITGATGTGKTATLQHMAEQFSSQGVAVFTADIKGDLAGLAFNAGSHMNAQPTKTAANPVILWDVFGQTGHPLHTTVREMGPLLLGRLLKLNDVQQSILSIAFTIAQDRNTSLINLTDLRNLLTLILENNDALKTNYGYLPSHSIGAIQRALLLLNDSGTRNLFREPIFDIHHLLKSAPNDKGYIHILDTRKLIQDPLLYSTFLLALLAQLFDKLPEVGDLPKPKLIFFFDEAHLLFKQAPQALLEKIEQWVRLVRSKGVGVYFVTQNPMDLPERVLGQLSNRIQHSMRGFTIRAQRDLRAIVETFRPNLHVDTAYLITRLGVGEALVSILDVHGVPSPVEHVRIIMPRSRMGVISHDERKRLIEKSPFYFLQKPTQQKKPPTKPRKLAKESVKRQRSKPMQTAFSKRQTPLEAFLASAARSFGTQFARQIMRRLNRLFGKKR